MKIKKLIVLLFISVNVFTQTTVDLGIKGGVNFSGFHTSDSVLTSNVGFNIGGTAQFKLTDSFYFLGELMYNRKGGTQNIRIGTINTKLDYIDIPIQMRYYFLKNLSLDAGPQIGFLINNNSEITSLTRKGEVIDIGETNDIDFAVNIGFTFDFNSQYSIQSRFSYGVTEVFKNYEYKNSVISLSFLYNFD